MVLPLSHTMQFQVDDQSPLVQWTVYQAFDRASDCEDYRLRAQGRAKSEAAAEPTDSHQALAAALMASQCIVSDDPRLKEK
jgi:hypothetical protein